MLPLKKKLRHWEECRVVLAKEINGVMPAMETDIIHCKIKLVHRSRQSEYNDSNNYYKIFVTENSFNFLNLPILNQVL